MADVWFAIPGELSTPTGGYAYDRRVIEELKALGWNVKAIALPGDFPAPSPASLRETERLLDETPDDAVILFDGLAYGALPSDLLDNVPRRYVALVHHPLALETGLSPARAAELKRTEQEALARAMRVVTTSLPTAELVARDFGVPKNRITVSEPGTEPAQRARGSDGPPRLLTVGSITPRKGFDTLVAALAKISDLGWQSRIVGALDRDSAAVLKLKEEIARLKLGDRIALLGTLSEPALAEEYDRAALFVLPSRFEGYGMAYAEAMARGLPVVACRNSGAVTMTVPAAAGIFIAPGDADELAERLRWLLSDPAEIKKRADAAWAHARKLPRWKDTAEKIAHALRKAAA